jgi:hypothetical protein
MLLTTTAPEVRDFRDSERGAVLVHGISGDIERPRNDVPELHL